MEDITDIEEIREIWKPYYDMDYCEACMYDSVNYGEKHGYDACNGLYDNDEHLKSTDVYILVDVGKDFPTLFEILDHIIAGNSISNEQKLIVNEIYEKWKDYDQLYCSPCLYDCLNYGDKHGHDACDGLHDDSEHLKDINSEELVCAGLHINVLINEINNKIKIDL